MLHSWTKNIGLILILALFIASCTKPEYSKDEPFATQEKSGVYIGSKNNFLYAFEPTTGEKLWEQNVGFELTYEPLVLNGLLFLSAPIGVLKINASSGEIVDTTFDLVFPGDTTRHYVLGPLAGKGTTIYGATNTGSMAAFDYRNRAIIWNVKIEAPESSPVLYNNLLIYSAGSKVIAINQDNGSQAAWSFTAPSKVSNPTVSASSVYVCDEDGELHTLDAESGAELWTYKAGGKITTSAIAYGGFVLFGCDDNRLYCIDLSLKAPAWTYLTDERVRSSPYAANNTIYFGSHDHHFYAVNVKDGSLKWRFRTNALIKSSPLVYGSTVYVGGYDQYFYAFDTSGQMKWKFNINGLIDASPVLYDANKTVTSYPAVSGLSSQ